MPITDIMQASQGLGALLEVASADALRRAAEEAKERLCRETAPMLLGTYREPKGDATILVTAALGALRDASPPPESRGAYAIRALELDLNDRAGAIAVLLACLASVAPRDLETETLEQFYSIRKAWSK